MGKKVRTQEESALQASRIFTDREEPRKSFWKCYNHFKENMKEGDIKVLVYYGVGGIGKSSLLRQLIKEMDEHAAAKTIGQSMHAYFDFNLKQEPRAVLEALRNKLAEDYGFVFSLFDLGCYVYAKKIGESRDKPEVKSFVERSTTLKFVFDAVEDVPIVGIASMVAKLADKGIAAFRNMKDKNSKELQDIDSKPHEELLDYLPVLFARDIATNMEGKDEPLVIFLDTYEQLVNEMAVIGVPQNNDLWLRDDNKGLILNAPSVFWVIAGREKLKWPKDWGDSLEQHILGNLSETDAKNFLQHAGIKDTELQDGIYKLTNGTPVYLDLCVDRYQSLVGNGEALRIENFGDNINVLIERFARYMDDARKDIVYILSCLGVWSDEMALEIGPKVLPNYSVTTYERVKGLSFIIESEKGHYNLHQTVGDVLYEDCPESIKEKTVSAAIAYCEEKLQGLDAFSSDFEYYVGVLLKQAVRCYTEDEKLLIFYSDQIRPYINKLNNIKRFHSIEEMFKPFWERASQNKESRLYAHVQMNYSFWLRGMGRYNESAEMAKAAYELYAKLRGAGDSMTLNAQSNYAESLRKLGRYKEALTLQKDRYEKIKNSPHKDILKRAQAILDVSIIYDEMGLYAKALPLKEKVLGWRRLNLEENHADTLNSMWRVAYSMEMLGRYREALALRQELYERYREKKGEDDETTIGALGLVATNYENLGQYDKAVQLRQDTLERSRRILGEDHLTTIWAIEALSQTCCLMGRYSDMLSLREQALEKRRTLLGENHPDTLNAIWRVAYALEQLGRYQEALALRQEVYDRYRETQGENFPATIIALRNIAIDYEKMGQYAKAEELRKEALERIRNVLGESHPKTLESMQVFAETYCMMGHYSEMLSLKEQVLEKRKALLGEDHPDTLSAMWGVAWALEQQGRYQEALALRQEVYDRYRDTQGVDVPNTIEALGNLAIDYEKLGQYDKALELRKETLERMRNTLGEDHPRTIGARQNLAKMYARCAMYDEAEELYKDNLERQERLTGKESLKTISALNSLAFFYFLKNEPGEGIPYAEKVVELISNNPNVSNRSRIEETDTLALLYASVNRLDEAYKMAQELLDDALKEYASDQKFIAKRHYTFAYVLNKMNRLDEALDYAQKSYDVRMQYLGEFDDDTKRTEELLNEIKSKKL